MTDLNLVDLEFAAVRLLHRYGFARSRLLSLRPPPLDPEMRIGRQRFGGWEQRYVFCMDVGLALDRMTPRNRRVLVQLVAAGRDRRALVRELNVTYRTLCRIRADALRAFTAEADRRGLLSLPWVQRSVTGRGRSGS